MLRVDANVKLRYTNLNLTMVFHSASDVSQKGLDVGPIVACRIEEMIMVHGHGS